MKSILRERWGSSAFSALATIALGLVLVLWPDRSVSLMCTILGGALLMFGIIYFFACFSKKGRAPLILMIPGAVLAGLGVWLMISAESVISLIQYVFGAVIIFHGIVDVQGVLTLAGYRAKKWWVDLLMALLSLALGVVILLNPFGSFSALVSLIGCALVYDGFSDLWLICRLARAGRAYERAREEEAELEAAALEEAEMEKVAQQAVVVAESEGREVE